MELRQAVWQPEAEAWRQVLQVPPAQQVLVSGQVRTSAWQPRPPSVVLRRALRVLPWQPALRAQSASSAFRPWQKVCPRLAAA